MQPIDVILDGKGRDLHVTAPSTVVLDAVDEMCRAHVGALLVMEADTLVGIFSERDLMTRVVLARKDPARTRVAEVMTREIECIEPCVSPREAMALVTNRRVRHLPVVEGRRIIGVVSIGDLVRWTIQDRESEIAQLTDYVTGRYPG